MNSTLIDVFFCQANFWKMFLLLNSLYIFDYIKTLKVYVFLHVMLRQLEDGVRNGALLGSTSTTIAMPRRVVAFTPCPEG